MPPKRNLGYISETAGVYFLSLFTQKVVFYLLYAIDKVNNFNTTSTFYIVQIRANATYKRTNG